MKASKEHISRMGAAGRVFRELWACGRCGTEVKIEDVFCRGCGAQFRAGIVEARA